MNIVVIDGQGGKFGSMIVTALKNTMPDYEVTAIGTNCIATSSMLKAGADKGASGENPVIFNAGKADIIIGPIGIVIANAMLGEVTPKMAEAVGSSKACKILLPTNSCNNIVAGTESLSLSESVEIAVKNAEKIVRNPCI